MVALEGDFFLFCWFFNLQPNYVRCSEDRVKREMMVAVLIHNSAARAGFWMRVKIPSSPGGEVKHQQPCFKNGFFWAGLSGSSPTESWVVSQAWTSTSKHPDLQLRAPHLLVEFQLKTPPHQPTSGSRCVKRNGTYSSEKRFFFQFSVPGKGSFC